MAFVEQMLAQELITLNEMDCMQEFASDSFQSRRQCQYLRYLNFLTLFCCAHGVEMTPSDTPLMSELIVGLKQIAIDSKIPPHLKSIAKYHLASLLMRNEKYELTDLQEAGLLLHELAIDPSLTESMPALVRYKQAELIYINTEINAAIKIIDIDEVITLLTRSSADSKPCPQMRYLSLLRLGKVCWMTYKNDPLLAKNALNLILISQDVPPFIKTIAHYYLGKLLVMGGRKASEAPKDQNKFVLPDPKKGCWHFAQALECPEISENFKEELKMQQLMFQNGTWNPSQQLQQGEIPTIIRNKVIALFSDFPSTSLLASYIRQLKQVAPYDKPVLEKLPGSNEMNAIFKKIQLAVKSLYEELQAGVTEKDFEFLKRVFITQEENGMGGINNWIRSDGIEFILSTEQHSDLAIRCDAYERQRRLFSNYFLTRKLDCRPLYNTKVSLEHRQPTAYYKETSQEGDLYTICFHEDEIFEAAILNTWDQLSLGIFLCYLEDMGSMTKTLQKNGELIIEVKGHPSVNAINAPSYPIACAWFDSVDRLFKRLDDFQPQYLELIKPALLHRILEVSAGFVNSCMLQCNKTRKFKGSKTHVYRQNLVEYIDATKRFHLKVGKGSSYYHEEGFLPALRESYVIASHWIPETHAFPIFFEAAQFFKKAHFCNNILKPYQVSTVWSYALEFYMRAFAAVDTSQDRLDVLKELMELAPEDIHEYQRIYKEFAKLVIDNKSVDAFPMLGFFFLGTLQYFRFQGEEDKANQLRSIIDHLEYEEYMPLNINQALNRGWYIDVKNQGAKYKIPFEELPLNMQEHLMHLGPSSPCISEVTFSQVQSQVRSTQKARGKKPRMETLPAEDRTTSTGIIETTTTAEVTTTTKSTTLSAKQEAKAKIELELRKARLKEQKSRALSPTDSMQTVSSVPSNTPAQVVQTYPQENKVWYLNSDNFAIFEKLFDPTDGCRDAVSLGIFDEKSFRNDIKLTRSEARKLIEGLGGEYLTSEAKGSHHKSIIKCIDENDKIIVNGHELTLISLDFDFNHPTSQTLTLPKKSKDRLPKYNVQQLRNKLLALNINPLTVKLKDT